MAKAAMKNRIKKMNFQRQEREIDNYTTFR